MSQSSNNAFVIVAQGEGAAAEIISGDLKEAIHRFMCVCGKPLKECETPHVPEDVAMIDNPRDWTHDESGEPFAFHWPHETGDIALYRLSDSEAKAPPPAELSRSGKIALLEDMFAPVKACPKCSAPNFLLRVGGLTPGVFRIICSECLELLEKWDEDSAGPLEDMLRRYFSASQPSSIFGRKPDGYAYRYRECGDFLLRFNNGHEVNGGKPIESVPYWFGRSIPANLPRSGQPWECVTCGAGFAEYVNGCPHCWGERELRSAVRRVVGIPGPGRWE